MTSICSHSHNYTTTLALDGAFHLTSCYNIGMAYSNQGDRRGGGNNFGRRPFGRPGGDRQMHQAVCSECGQNCQVPFVPSGEKPVFCSDCFAKKRGSLDTRRFSDGPRPSPITDQFSSINAKLDKIIELLTPKLVVAAVPEPKPVVEKKKKAAKK